MCIRDRNDTGENWRTDTEMIPKHDNLIGEQSTLSLILWEILGGSMTVILPKIAPKPYTKTGGSAISVSYTHLDVYKRQAYGRYKNVILTDTELSELQAELPDKIGRAHV